MYFCVSNESYYYLNTTKQLVFPIYTDHVLCEVRTEFLRIISMSLFKWADPRLWLPTDEFPTRRLQFDPRPVTLISLVGKVVLGQVFLGVLYFSTVSIIPPMFPYSPSSIRRCYQKYKRAKLGSLQKSVSLSEIGEFWTQKEFRVVFHLSPQKN